MSYYNFKRRLLRIDMTDLDQEFAALKESVGRTVSRDTLYLHLQAMAKECAVIFERLASPYYGHLATLGYTPTLTFGVGAPNSIKTLAVEYKVLPATEYK